MIKIVCVVPFDGEPLRLSIFEPRNPDRPNQSLVYKGYKLALDFDTNIGEFLRGLSYLSRGSTRLHLKRLEDTAGVTKIDVDLLSPLSMHVRDLGTFNDIPVYALVCGTCYAEVSNSSHLSLVCYELCTIEQSLDRCSDAEFYTIFLKNAITNLDKVL